MPDMNGLDVARVIRTDEELKQTAIIMLTSVDNISDSQEFKQLDIDAHLTKPARASQLLESIVDMKRMAELREFEEAVQSDSSMAKHVSSQSAPSLAAITSIFGEKSRYQVGEDDIKSTPATSTGIGDEAAEIRSDVAKLIADAENATISDLCVLVAEDNEVNQMVFTQILEYLDYNFLIVENGKQAVDAAIQHQPQIILMDVSMPVMNGLDATREIRNQMGTNHSGNTYTPIIIGVTAHALKDDKQMCFDAGIDDYMSKPISPDMLIEKIGKWLSSSGDDVEPLQAG
jgi:CheY-like chemotaxis protein